jgi:hypothetical protein
MATDELVGMYEAILQGPTTEQAREITRVLLEAYGRPETIFLLLEILGTSPAKGLGQSAALGLRRCLLFRWQDTLAESDACEVVKQLWLAVLPIQRHLIVAQNLIESSKELFRTEAQKWPELWAALPTLTDTPDHVIVGNYLIAELAEHLDKTFIVDNLPTFVEFGGLVIESDTPQGIAACYLMLGGITSFLPASYVGDLRDIV